MRLRVSVDPSAVKGRASVMRRRIGAWASGEQGMAAASAAASVDPNEVLPSFFWSSSDSKQAV
jgi:hypothetical protein